MGTMRGAAIVLLLVWGVPGRAQIEQPGSAEALEGAELNLNCSHSKISTETVVWYRQFPGGGPQFIVSGYRATTPSSEPEGALHIPGDRKSSALVLRRGRLADAAVYYCALSPYGGGRNQLIFGAGTKLIVRPKLDNSPPSIYPLTSDNKNLLACLVTDFFPGNISVGSRPNAKLTSLNASLVVMKGSGEASYGTVLWGPRDELACTADHDNQNFQLTDFDEEDDTCMIVEMDENFETDKNLNFLSLTLLGLRIVFVKTVAINLLLTLSQWKR